MPLIYFAGRCIVLPHILRLIGDQSLDILGLAVSPYFHLCNKCSLYNIHTTIS